MGDWGRSWLDLDCPICGQRQVLRPSGFFGVDAGTPNNSAVMFWCDETTRTAEQILRHAVHTVRVCG
jgi:hypothetical protein